MLNNKLIEEILNHNFNDIHWKTEDSTSDSILFYKLSDHPNSEKVFWERIEKTSYKVLITNKKTEKKLENIYVIEDQFWPELQDKLLNSLYPLPSLKLIAITGTNGKTTTADLVLQVANLLGKKGISIGTLGVREVNKTLVEFGLTSPSQIDLRKFLYQYGKDRDFCVLEASSHALDQKRVYGLKFDAAAWTSFSQDHLDYHRDMESYFEAKLKIFHFLKDKAKLIVPADQKELYSKISGKYSNVEFSAKIESKLPLFFSVSFNRNNLEVAVSLVKEVFKLNVPDIYEKLIPTDGRFYLKKYRSNYIVVDFAHTPDALENICLGIKTAFPNHSLKVLFGCGGDRDRTKRPLMGSMAEKYSDWIYLSSDNPRSEDPLQIIEDIKSGMSSSQNEIIPDRRFAVQKAFRDLKENEVLLLAGKGHENYILTNGVKEPYSDIEEVEKFLTENK